MHLFAQFLKNPYYILVMCRLTCFDKAVCDTDSGPRPPEFMLDNQNIISSGPVDLQNIQPSEL